MEGMLFTAGPRHHALCSLGRTYHGPTVDIDSPGYQLVPAEMYRPIFRSTVCACYTVGDPPTERCAVRHGQHSCVKRYGGKYHT